MLFTLFQVMDPVYTQEGIEPLNSYFMYIHDYLDSQVIVTC